MAFISSRRVRDDDSEGSAQGEVMRGDYKYIFGEEEDQWGTDEEWDGRDSGR